MAKPANETSDLKAAIKAVRSLVKIGGLEHARTQAAELASKHPDSVEPLVALSKVAELQCDFIQAAEIAEKAFKLEPTEPTHLIQASHAQMRAGYPEEGLRILDRGMAKFKDFVPFHINYANSQERQNNNDEAMKWVESCRKRGVDALALHMVEGKVLLKRKQWDEAEKIFKNILTMTNEPDESLAAARFQLVKLYDKTERYDDAFAMATEAYRELNWTAPITAFTDRLEEAAKVFNERNLRMWRRPNKSSKLPICIIGMPRSGTSLVEQILGMHSQISQAGEIAATSILSIRAAHMCDSYHNYPQCLIDMRPEDADAMQDWFVEYLEPYRNGAARVSNKSLMNYEHLGLMSVILPDTQAIHIKRHPLDNCLSCHLTEIIVNHHRYAAKLEDLGAIYKARQKLWHHWQEVLDIPMLEVPYECLTADQETWTRRLIDLTGLEWEENCLEFHKSSRSAMTISYDQVNQKMYRSSVERWRNYEKHLGPLIDALGDEIEAHESLVNANMPSE
ncbi:MAG: hypothetical protein CMJ39_09070 [Phycisphaerae bacterium]|nr:hypothetical protein [Phycisphaerae bacterium]|tara:strand:+ start:767 stop:2290 length:1524 start_codon:yes stop_codon:yes gene_type:complete